MNLNLAIIGFSVVLITAMTRVLWAARLSKQGDAEQFLLGGRTLSRLPIVNLLLSNSFGLNALFYATWLGFTVGAWALLIQAAWAASFFLLLPFAGRFRTVTSLHDLLRQNFGRATQILAALCSLIGFMYLMGWEVGIGEAMLGSFLRPEQHWSVSWFTVALVVFTLLYTVIGGIRGNASADGILNLMKVGCLFLVTALLLQRFFSHYSTSFFHALFPSLETMREKLGYWGLVTNLTFNLAWQFVDNSSWQSIVAGSQAKEYSLRNTLRSSGIVIFLTIGLIGTIWGIALANTLNVDPNNILTLSAQVLPPPARGIATFAVLLVAFASMMSLLDGLFLASALALLTDVVRSRRWTDSTLSNVTHLGAVRLSLFAIAAAGIWGVKAVLRVTGADLFSFVYIVIITQLALLGPVLLAFANRTGKFMWVAILLALATGFGSALYGTARGVQYMVDGAGTFTIVVSAIAAIAFSRSNLVKES